ncbi:MAG: hypothetical protein U0Z53_28690 [Blastocatellia bacterium]
MQGKVRFLRRTTIFTLALCLLCSPLSGLAQSPFQQEQQPAKPPVNQSDDPLLKKFVWRGIGPASMGGRIDDIAGVDSNPYVFYVAFATGGLWKTINNGTTFEPVFDTYSTHSIGDVAVCQSDPNILWVGTGEPNNRQSSSFGDGIYKSTDGGKTWANMGLKETQTIARVVIDPKDANTVYVAALGHLFGPNKERGIYKTTDGGKSWNLVKFIDENTGFTDLVIDPVDTKTLYAASYQRRRTAAGFNGGGPGSALWKTVDAGKTWTKMEGGGLPEGLLGRIGIDLARSNPNVIYAQMEVGASNGTGVPEETPGGQPTPQSMQQAMQERAEAMGFGQPSNKPPDPKKSGIWRSDDKGKTWRVVSNNNNRPMYYSQIRVDPSNPEIVYTGGLNFTKSTDGGKTFKNVQGIAHSDHHAIWINPKNGSNVIIGNDGGLDISYDQGETWEFVNTIPAAQFYAVSADMRKPYFVCGGLQDNGSWCGPSAVRMGGGGFGGGGGAAGITNADWFRVGGGDGFYTLNDPTDYNIIYAESQNGAIQRLDLRTGQSRSIRPRAAQRPRGPAARQSEPNPEQTPATQPNVSAQSSAQITMPTVRPMQQNQQAQGGQADQMQMMMMMQGGGFGGGNPMQSNIVPAPPVGEQYRFYWNTPVIISPHNPRTLYVGANRLFKSLDRGDTWTFASPDLTKQIDRSTLPIMGVDGKAPMASKHDGYANNSVITTIAESPVLPGVLWVGTDDGNLQLSRDGGTTWTNVSKNISGAPEGYVQISRVEPSHFEAGTCYVTLDNHRNDDLKPYAYVTRDYGATWSSVTGNLPNGSINVIREDLKNKNLLFVGAEFGLFVSLDGGKDWKKFMTGMPMVRVDDILIHPRDNDLIAGTHGRGIYICDDITPLEQLSEKVMLADAHLFDVRPGVQWLNDATLSRSVGGAKVFRGQNLPPGTAISYFLKSAPSGEVKVTVTDITGKVVRNITGTKEAGLNRVQWNLRGDPPPRPAGFPGGPQATENPPGSNQPPGAQPGQQPAGQQPAGQGRGGGGGRFAFAGPALEPGTYLVKLSVDGKEMTTRVVIEADTWKNQ